MSGLSDNQSCAQLTGAPVKSFVTCSWSAGENAVLRHIEERIAKVTHLPVDHGEGMQVLWGPAPQDPFEHACLFDYDIACQVVQWMRTWALITDCFQPMRRCSTTTTDRSISRTMTSSMMAFQTGAQGSESPPSSCTCAPLCFLRLASCQLHGVYEGGRGAASSALHLVDSPSGDRTGPRQTKAAKQCSRWGGHICEGRGGQTAPKSKQLLFSWLSATKYVFSLMYKPLF